MSKETEVHGGEARRSLSSGIHLLASISLYPKRSLNALAVVICGHVQSSKIFESPEVLL